MDRYEITFFWSAVLFLSALFGLTSMLVVFFAFGKSTIHDFLVNYGSILGSIIAVIVAFYTIRAQYRNTSRQLRQQQEMKDIEDKSKQIERMFATIQDLYDQILQRPISTVRDKSAYRELFLYISKIKLLQSLYNLLNEETFKSYIQTAEGFLDEMLKALDQARHHPIDSFAVKASMRNVPAKMEKLDVITQQALNELSGA